MSPRGTRWDAHRAAEIATRRAVIARDAGLRRISTVTRWMIAGVVGLSGALALVAANAFHGRTIPSTPSSTTTSTSTPAQTTTTPATTTPATTTPAQTGLQAPSQSPSPVQSPPVVVSGGS